MFINPATNQQTAKRVAFFIDGYNLYHAIDSLQLPHLKWINLRKLAQQFVGSDQTLVQVNYFSARAKHTPLPTQKRHEAFIIACEQVAHACGYYGTFKQKWKSCKKCNASWPTHEEKESDVNLAVRMVRGAFLDEYDIAYIVTQDSDMAYSVKVVCQTGKRVKVLTPPGRPHSNELQRIVTSKNCRHIKLIHLESSLLDKEYRDEAGRIIVTRPREYDPPPTHE